MKMTLHQLKTFLDQPAISVVGICKEAGISPQSLYFRLRNGKLPGKRNLGKLEAVMKRYGWKEE